MASSTQGTPLAVSEQIRHLQVSVRQDERDLAWKRRRARRWGTALALAVVSIPGLVAWSAVQAGHHKALVAGNAVLVTVLVFSMLTLLVASVDHLVKAHNFLDVGPVVVADRYDRSHTEMQERLETNREALRLLSALSQAPLRERRGLYREDVAEVIAQYQTESRKYRRVHNGLQNLVMIGSTAMTTIAALEAKNWNWQSITVVCLGFSVTVATAFSGYYKYRERSYFLRQTADAIEEETNALALGVGEYRHFTQDQGDEALAVFTQRVEALRNEQRRREQQLDQPADQTAPLNPPPA
ncbi:MULTISPECIES: DUF4231 domain-containing protein [unclassified Streptomyces]|uniref:DUF4231 domain-containing protein n=1 Tax=unclassified Streptomyces TaxID=2593676 RepID=UPI002024731B|nr:DUF4231 domain-containing protein [Streptomyces sp. A 4/2]